MADGVQQVRLAEAGLAVDEERVVRLRRRLGDGERRGVREAVRGADDEGVEGVPGVQARLARLERLSSAPPRARNVAGGVRGISAGSVRATAVSGAVVEATEP